MDSRHSIFDGYAKVLQSSMDPMLLVVKPMYSND